MIDPFRCNSGYHFLKCAELLKFIAFLPEYEEMSGHALSRTRVRWTGGRPMGEFTYWPGYLAIVFRAAKVARPE